MPFKFGSVIPTLTVSSSSESPLLEETCESDQTLRGWPSKTASRPHHTATMDNPRSPIMFAQNSLVNLRSKMAAAPQQSLRKKKRALPIEELRQKILDKKRPRVSKAVSFDLDRNTTFYRDYSPQDLENAWVSDQEANTIRQSMTHSVLLFRTGASETEHNSIRGIEIHSNPSIMREKIERGKAHVSLVLEQQRAVEMGHEPNLISQMAQTLSAEDVASATNFGVNDATAAYVIYSEMEAPDHETRQVIENIAKASSVSFSVHQALEAAASLAKALEVEPAP